MNSELPEDRNGYGCPEALADLQLLLDGAAPASADAFERHRRACDDCRPRIAAARLLLDGVARFSRPAPSQGFADRICHAAFVDRRADRSRRNARWLGAISALAAGILVAVVTLRPDTNQRGPFSDDAIRMLSHLPEWKTQPTLPSLRDRLAETSSAVVALTRRAADETLDRTFNLLPRAVPLKADFPADRLEPAMQMLSEARTGAAASLEPIADTARRAFDLFRRELAPAGESTAPKPSM